MAFILASGSPRRKSLLKKLVPDFEIIIPDVDEKLIEGVMNPKDLPFEESRLKAYKVLSSRPNDEVLAMDTVVILNGQALGKPKDEKDAFRMLKEEQGKKQVVITGYTYLGKGREISRTVRSVVEFNPLTDEQILEYIRKFKPLDKAGSYGLQDEAGLIKKIEGSYDNVMGFPTEDIACHVFNRKI